MAGDLTIKTWGGNNINDTTNYVSYFTADGFDVRTRADAVAIEAARPERFPTYVRNDPASRRINLEVQLRSMTLANIEQLKKWFDHASGQQYLIATDENAVDRRILAFPEKVYPKNGAPNIYIVQLLASTPVWEESTANTPAATNITSSGATFSKTNVGNFRTYPTFTITPKTVMAHGDSWIKRRRVVIANRSELPISDPVGDGWPINVFGTTLDTDALNTAGKLQSDLDDLRVMLEGAQINRWPDPATDNASSRLWCNLQFRPRKTVTLAVIASSGSPANGGSIAVTNPQGTAGWPDAGFFIVEDECIQYTGRTPTSFTGLTRGARATTAAAHSADTAAYWVEHPFLDVIYDYTAATNPNPPADRKPAIDLANSTNASFKWDSVFVQTGRRSACWQPEFSDEGDTAEAIRLYDSGGGVLFEDDTPTASKPNFNNLLIDTPYGIKAAASAVTLDVTVEPTMLLRGFITDLSGYESVLISQGPTSILTGQAYTPAAVASRLRLAGRVGIVIGNRSGTNTVQIAVGTAQNYVEVQPFEIDADVTLTSITVKLEDGSPASSNGLNLIIAGSGQTFAGTFAPQANIANASVPANGAAAEVTIDFSPPLRLSAGSYSLYVCQDGVVNNTVLLTAATPGINPKMTGLRTFWFYLSTESSEAGFGAPNLSGDSITLDNIILNWDDATPRTPKIQVGGEETLYLANFRLKNDTTGDYIDVLFPMTLDQSVTIDCEAKTITDNETGVQIPFALTASNPSEWIYMQPGANQFSYTEAGLVSVNVATAWRGRWN